MSTKPAVDFTTQIVHADRWGGAEKGAIHQAIHSSVQYGYDQVEDLIAVFQGTAKGGYNYARQGTPTTAALEAKITQMEGGTGSIVFSTGMAALCAMFFTLLKAGDHLVASKFVFGNTNSVFGTLADLGVQVTTVDATDAAQVQAAVRPNTRMVFVETIANPGTQVPDLEGIGALCRDKGLLYVVDNTVASPYLFRPATVGAGLVMNSLTKSIGGHGDALGGAITDTGLFDWAGYPNIFEAYRKGDPKSWGLQQVRKKGLRDMGGTLASHSAHQIAVGAETLALRMDRSSATALTTTVKASSAHSSGSSSAKVLPLSMMPRTMRKKCVSGSTSPIHCAQRGMPATGNMKPLSSIDGRKKNSVICTACNWLRASVLKVKPTARLATMNTPIMAPSSGRLPTMGTANSTQAAPRITISCT